MRAPILPHGVALTTLLSLVLALAGCSGDGDRPTAGSIDLPERKLDLPKTVKVFKSSKKRAR